MEGRGNVRKHGWMLDTGAVDLEAIFQLSMHLQSGQGAKIGKDSAAYSLHESEPLAKVTLDWIVGGSVRAYIDKLEKALNSSKAKTSL